jgi:uncharacterized protein
MTAITINMQIALALIGGGINSLSLQLASHAITDALRAANAARDARAKQACMRMLNWLRAEMRRVS